MDLSTLSELRTPQPLAIERGRWHAILQAAGEASGTGRPRASSAQMAGSVAVVSVSGFIGYKSQLAEWYGCELTTLIATLRDLDRSQQVSAIVLDVDSPGGTVCGTPEAAEAIRNMQTPVIAVANPFAASAAVWLAAAADVFLSLGSGSVGSVGVWSMHVDASGWNERAGLRVSLIASSPEKVELSSDLPLSKDARAHMQGEVDRAYLDFGDAIRRYRGVAVTKQHARMMDPADAAKIGLIDGTIDSLQTAVQLAADVGRLGPGRRQAYIRQLEIERLAGQGPPERRWFHAMGTVTRSAGTYKSLGKEQAEERAKELRKLGVM